MPVELDTKIFVMNSLPSLVSPTSKKKKRGRGFSLLLTIDSYCHDAAAR
jgi:hypothetical protein